MRSRRASTVTLCLAALALACCAVMFLSGTDVWHDAGRPDFWSLQGTPYHDLRAFVIAFYSQVIVLAALVVVVVVNCRTAS